MSRYWKQFDELKIDGGASPRPNPGMPSMKKAKEPGEKTADWPGPPGKTGQTMNKVKFPKIKTFVKGDY